MVVETMKKEHLSIYAAMQEFGINDHKIIERWERIYLEEGPEGLAIERRGRSSKGRPPKQLPKQVEEDLLAEVQRLRAENDYLKNLQALVLEEERRRCKKHCPAAYERTGFSLPCQNQEVSLVQRRSW